MWHFNIAKVLKMRWTGHSFEVQHFNYKNRYVHRTHSSKKENHQNRLLYLPVFFEILYRKRK